ncbi:MAG: MMPL family transporter [Deltaproteobacteria bacterium]|nr:MMPL family transporter [Deltaproteobacteria bacterium]
MRERIIKLATSYPRTIFVVVALLVVGIGSQMARVVVDTDPQNMLPADQAERLFHNQAKKTFQLHDMLVVGVVNDKDPDGVFNPHSLARIHALSRKIAAIDGVIERDLLSPATVDKTTPDGAGTVRFSWLLAEPPKTRAEALRIKADALRLPMLNGSLVTENGQAVAIYVPLSDKKQSHRISQEIKAAVTGLSGAEQYFITGLPVAEDTFGVEMFVQMAISAPMAALVIFIIMWWFFRSLPLITAPMLLSMATVLITMGALIGLGYTVHIMSSMIPIFLMPIAVVNSIHILSEFSDNYAPGKDKREVIRHVMGKLFTPMFYTSLTTIAGFGSLAFAPIPPVKVFGAFVALGVLISFLLSVIFIPAYIVSLSDKTLARLPGSDEEPAEGEEAKGLLARILPKVGGFSVAHSRIVVMALLVISAISAYGISKIVINDNPVLWFKESHEIRIADKVLNQHFAGTYPAYVVLEKTDKDPQQKLAAAVNKALAPKADATAEQRKASQAVLTAYKGFEAASKEKDFGQRINGLIDKVEDATDNADETHEAFWATVTDRLEKAQSAHKYFQSPAALAYIDALQQELGRSKIVGKSNSLVDVVKTLNRDLHDGSAKYYMLPKSSAAVAQSLLTYQSSHRPHDLWHFATPDMRQASVWVQLKSGDNQNMRRVMDRVDAFVAQNPPPAGVSVKWAGMTYLNVIWQDAMVAGMFSSLLGSFGIVLLMMIFLFRSVIFGLLSMIPLSITIAFIYGLIGLMGKDYDMPVAVLSAMTLGLSVDFAIHFLQRSRRLHLELGSWQLALAAMFHGPGRAISRNAIVIAIGFLPLLAAPLVPYNTVGFFMAAIMGISGVVTLMLLPAVMNLIRNKLPALKADSQDHNPNTSPTSRRLAEEEIA